MLPHQLLLQPYGCFLIDACVYAIGEKEVMSEVLKGADSELAVIVNKLLEL